MAARRFRLRLEPYDPDARDADGDGIVQEGTAWERPAGTRILNELGEDIRRGALSLGWNSQFSIVDKDGKRLDYIPSFAKGEGIPTDRPKTSLEKRGLQTIKSSGVPDINEIMSTSTFLSESGRLSPEPYNPDQIDVNGSGILQVGTAWERPVGTRFVDSNGRDIEPGLSSPFRNSTWRLVDKNGNDVSYVPTYRDSFDLNPDDPKSPLEKMGYQSIGQMGLPTVKDLVLPSTKPKNQDSSIQPEGPPDVISPVASDVPDPSDDASRILGISNGILSPSQEDAIVEVDKLISAIKDIGSGIDEDEFGYRYATDPDSSDLRGVIDPWSSGGQVGNLARMLPREVTAKDGSRYGVRPDLIEVSRDGTILIEGLLLDEAGREIGSFSRFFDLDGEKNLIAHHTVLDVGIEHRDKGIGSAFNAQLELAYRRLGVDRIEVDASSSIRYEGDERTPMDIQRGVSFWPRQGYDWRDAMGQETTMQLFDRLFVDGSSEPNMDRVYIEGVSSGPRPQGSELFDIAYFASRDEWDSFADSFARVETSKFDDVDRPVAGDLMRWAGVDEWVARRSAGYNPIYVKKLNQEKSAEQTSSETEKILSRDSDFSPERTKAISDASAVFRDFLESGKSISSSYDFGYFDLGDLFVAERSDLSDLSEGKQFGMHLLQMFQGSLESRDGSSIIISPGSSYSYYGLEQSFSIVGYLEDPNGNRIGKFSRSLRLTKDDDNKPILVVEHDELKIDPDRQGQGIGTAFNAQMEIVYRQLGASEIETNGLSGGSYDNQFIGATHWPRSGFDWGSEFSKDEFLRVLDELVIFDDDTDTYAPSGIAYVEGLSSGERPIGPDRRTVAYFSSVEEWETFIELLEQSRGERLSDENRVVAGDLVRWDGADDWFAGGEYSFDYTKKLKES